jgi:ceramide glucosyltransferase
VKWLSLFCITASVFGCAYALVAVWAARRFVRRAAVVAPATWPDISILKPLSGLEPRLQENLESFVKQDYPGRLQVIFGVQDPYDSVIAMVKSLMRKYPQADLRLVVSRAMHGANRKVSNLINMAPEIRHPLIVLADSDVLVGPDYLRTLAGAVAEPGVGAVTCLYLGLATGGFWSRLAAMAVHDHFLPGATVGLALGLARPCVGQTIALSRDTLALIGGFESIANRLADDYALGEAVRRVGLRVVVSPMLVVTMFPEKSFRDLARHELRWARTIFMISPAGYIGSVITHALPLSLIGAALRGFDGWGLAAVLAAFASRAFLKFRLAREFRLPNPNYALAFGRDILSFAIYLGAFWLNRVSWRGRNFIVQRDGTIVATVDRRANSAKYGRAFR